MAWKMRARFLQISRNGLSKTSSTSANFQAHLALCSAADAMDVELKAIARGISIAVRLMTVPGVGQMVALAYIATLDDAARFKKSKDERPSGRWRIKPA